MFDVIDVTQKAGNFHTPLYCQEQNNYYDVGYFYAY